MLNDFHLYLIYLDFPFSFFSKFIGKNDGTEKHWEILNDGKKRENFEN